MMMMINDDDLTQQPTDGAVVMSDGIGDITGALGNGNETTGDTTGDTIEEGVV